MVEKGYCQCGCGKKTKIVKKTITKWGRIKGEPFKYLQGHNKRKYYRSLEKQIFEIKDRWYLRCRDNSTIHWSHVIYSNYFLGGKEIPENMHVHHKNGISSDDSPENLELLSIQEHTSFHKSKVTILKRKEETKMFSSATLASKFLGLSSTAVTVAIRKKCRAKGWVPFYQQDDYPKNIGKEKGPKTTILEKNNEIKQFSSAAEASRFLGLKAGTVSAAIKVGCRVGGWNPSYLEDYK